MALCADDLKAAGFPCPIVQLDIGTTACHVGGNGHCLVDAGLGHDLRLQLMELGVENLVGNPLPLKHLAQKFGSLDGNGTHQNRLALFVSLLHVLNHGGKFLLLGLVHHIV